MRLRALKAAFPHTLPILTGFFFLGMAYGIYSSDAGFSPIYPMITSLIVYGGSLEFVTVEMLTNPFSPLSTFLMALIIQARHLFYGISMLEKYKGTGAKKPFLIFGMADETFSINYSAQIPDGIDKSWFMFFVTILHQFYWFVGTTTGAILGSFLPFSTEGISFVMTAMFVVIFLDQWLKEGTHYSSIMGIIVSIVCLLIFGSGNFMIPTMISIIVLLTVFRKPLEKMMNETETSKIEKAETVDSIENQSKSEVQGK